MNSKEIKVTRYLQKPLLWPVITTRQVVGIGTQDISQQKAKILRPTAQPPLLLIFVGARESMAWQSVDFPL